MAMGTDHTADYRSLSVLTGALIGGIVLFSLAAVVIHLMQGAFVHDDSSSNKIFSALLAITVLVVLGARVIYNRRVEALKETNQTSKEKLDLFRVITITHMALCEIPAILSVICFLVLGNYGFLLPVGIALVEMIRKFPTQTKIESTINSGTF